MNTRIRKCLGDFFGVLLIYFFTSQSVQAVPINFSIVSGTGWLSSTAPGDGWTTADFNNSSWIPAYAPYPNNITQPSDIVAGTSANLMWYWNDPNNNPTGENGKNEVFFRYDFTLSATNVELTAWIVADDNFELYLNGIKLFSDYPLALHKKPNNQPDPARIDILGGGWLIGNNVLAIHAVDGALPHGENNGYEYVFFDGNIHSTPEPASITLLLGGFAGLLWSLRANASRSALLHKSTANPMV